MPGYSDILKEIKKNKGKSTQHSGRDSYLGSGHAYYKISVPVLRQIAKEWLRKNKDISEREFVTALDGLYKGKSFEEKSIASQLLSYHHVHRKVITPKQLDSWLGHLIGWAEIDALCQNVFTAEEMLRDWKLWSSFIRKLSEDKNINKRRASLVLLTGPVVYSSDERFLKLSFEMIEKLKQEKPILITKAISWLLRSMVKNHKKEVSAYLEKNLDTLPKIAIRETRRKIQTGRK